MLRHPSKRPSMVSELCERILRPKPKPVEILHSDGPSQRLHNSESLSVVVDDRAAMRWPDLKHHFASWGISVRSECLETNVGSSSFSNFFHYVFGTPPLSLKFLELPVVFEPKEVVEDSNRHSIPLLALFRQYAVVDGRRYIFPRFIYFTGFHQEGQIPQILILCQRVQMLDAMRVVHKRHAFSRPVEIARLLHNGRYGFRVIFVQVPLYPGGLASRVFPFEERDIQHVELEFKPPDLSNILLSDLAGLDSWVSLQLFLGQVPRIDFLLEEGLGVWGVVAHVKPNRVGGLIQADPELMLQGPCCIFDIFGEEMPHLGGSLELLLHLLALAA